MISLLQIVFEGPNLEEHNGEDFEWIETVSFIDLEESILRKGFNIIRKHKEILCIECAFRFYVL